MTTNTIKITSRATALIAVTVTSAFALLGASSAAAEYPEQPIRMVTTVPSGSSGDIAIRLLTPKISEVLGQQVVVENKAGAGGGIAAELVARAKPDGYTIFFAATQSQAANPHIRTDINYDPIEDFTPIAKVFAYDFVLAVPATLPVNTVAELVAHIEANPNARYGSSGAANSSHLLGEAFANEADLEMRHIPYNTGGQAMNELINGTVSLMFYPYNSFHPFIESGQLRPLATTGVERQAQLPDVPTMVEAGFPELVFSSWLGIYAPAGTSSEVVEKLYDATETALADDMVRDRLTASGYETSLLSPAEFAEFTRSELDRYGTLIEHIGLKAE